MNKLMLVVSCAALTFGAAAETYTWTGGETTSGNWNDSGSWSAAGGTSGVPGGGDTAVVNDEVTFTSGIAIAGDTLKITSSKAVTISGVISGAGALDVNASTELTLSGANTYAGGTTARGKVRLSNATAFGSNRTVLHANGTLRFAAAGATYAYDITPTGCDNYYYNIEASGTLDGSIASTRVDYFNTTIHTESTGSGAIFEITGRVAVKDRAQGGTLTLRPRGTGKIRILGGLDVKKICGDTTGDGWSYGWRELGGACSVGTIELAYVKGFLCLSSTVLSSGTLLDFKGYAAGDDACVNLNGFDQTANRLVTQEPASYNTKAWRIDSPTDAATLTLAPSQDALTNYAYVMGKVSLVLDAPAAETVQIFQGRASTTTGDLTVRSGVLRIADGATFPNVTKVTVEENGTLDLRTAAFSTKAVALSLETGATVYLAKDIELMVASLTVDGELQCSGTYPFGDGRIVVPTPVSPTSTGVWTGAGATESSLDLANWEGGYPGQIPVTFATGGVRAKLAEDLLTASVAFLLPDATEAFTVASDESAPDAALHVAGNVTVAAGTVPHTATVSAPLSLDAAAVGLEVSGANDKLVVEGPIAQGAASVALTKTGPGTLRLNGSNSTFSTGSVKVNQGAFYLKGGALGGTEAAPLPVTVSMPDAVSPVRFDGGVFNQKFTIVTSQNGVNVYANAGTTNVIKGSVTVQHNSSMNFVLEANSSTAFDGGYFGNWIYQYQPAIELCEGARLYVTNKVYQTGMDHTSPSFIRSRSVGRPSEDQNVYLGAKGSCAKNGLVLVGPMKVTFTAENVFTGAEGGFDTPLRLMRINNADEYLKPVILDLNGHSQRFGSLATRPSSQAEYGYLGCWGDSANSYFTSATPATLDVYQNGTQNDTPWNSTFRGAVSLVKHGEKTLTLGGVSSSSGRLEVAEGRLDFTDNGAWTNVSVVAVSGGTLAVDTSARLKRRADYYLSGGKLDIAAGVRLVAENLYVPDGNGGWTKAEPGTYTAADLPAYVSGEGALRVRGGGYSVIIR